MAQSKKSAKDGAAKAIDKTTPKGGRIDPFKTKKTKQPATKIQDTVTPSPDVAEAIDKFREYQEQARHFEGEATVHKDKVQAFCQAEYAKRLQNGLNGSFKILGDETMVTYVISESSAGLSEEDVEDFARTWGEEAAEELIARDFHSIRFDPEVLEANYDQVVEALQTLPPEVLERLFKPMLMKARSGAVNSGKKYAKTPEEMQDLIRDLKIKNYIK